MDIRGYAAVSDLPVAPLARKGKAVALKVDALDVRVLVVEKV